MVGQRYETTDICRTSLLALLVVARKNVRLIHLFFMFTEDILVYDEKVDYKTSVQISSFYFLVLELRWIKQLRIYLLFYETSPFFGEAK